MRDLQLTFFNNPYIVNTLTEGKEYIFYGKVSGTLLRKEMSVPEFYPVSSAPSVCPISVSYTHLDVYKRQSL